MAELNNPVPETMSENPIPETLEELEAECKREHEYNQQRRDKINLYYQAVANIEQDLRMVWADGNKTEEELQTVVLEYDEKRKRLDQECAQDTTRSVESIVREAKVEASLNLLKNRLVITTNMDQEQLPLLVKYADKLSTTEDVLWQFINPGPDISLSYAAHHTTKYLKDMATKVSNSLNKTLGNYIASFVTPEQMDEWLNKQPRVKQDGDDKFIYVPITILYYNVAAINTE